MFTGIIEHLGTVAALGISPSAGRVTIDAPTLAPGLAISNSVAVNGCCLTVVALDETRFSADLSAETLQKTSFGSKTGSLRKGSRVNLEQPLTTGNEFGGHFVLGHVDTIGSVTHLQPEAPGSGSWKFGIQVSEDFARYIVPKSSITIDGISLTVADWNPRTCVVGIAVIPYTYEHTNIRELKPGDAVNLEADILGKYVERYLQARNGAPQSAKTMARLIEEGF